MHYPGEREQIYMPATSSEHGKRRKAYFKIQAADRKSDHSSPAGGGGHGLENMWPQQGKTNLQSLHTGYASSALVLWDSVVGRGFGA